MYIRRCQYNSLRHKYVLLKILIQQNKSKSFEA
jgi:hypothetical protein